MTSSRSPRAHVPHKKQVKNKRVVILMEYEEWKRLAAIAFASQVSLGELVRSRIAKI